MNAEERAHKVAKDCAEGQCLTPIIPAYKIIAQALREHGNEKLVKAAHVAYDSVAEPDTVARAILALKDTDTPAPQNVGGDETITVWTEGEPMSKTIDRS